MLTQRQTYFLASLTVALGFGMHGITQYHLDRKMAQGQNSPSTAALLSSEIDTRRRRNYPGGSPTSEDVANMLNDLKGKTTREKLEVCLCNVIIHIRFTISLCSDLLQTAVYGAHKAHDIGFPQGVSNKEER